jgi:hypothetical protein
MITIFAIVKVIKEQNHNKGQQKLHRKKGE